MRRTGPLRGISSIASAISRAFHSEQQKCAEGGNNASPTVPTVLASERPEVPPPPLPPPSGDAVPEQHVHMHSHSFPLRPPRRAPSRHRGMVAPRCGPAPLSPAQAVAVCHRGPRSTPPPLVRSPLGRNSTRPLQLTEWTPTYPARVSDVLALLPPELQEGLTCAALARRYATNPCFRLTFGARPAETWVEWHPLFARHPCYGAADALHAQRAEEEAAELLRAVASVPTFPVPLDVARDVVGADTLSSEALRRLHCVIEVIAAPTSGPSPRPNCALLVKLTQGALPLHGAGAADASFAALCGAETRSALCALLAKWVPATDAPFEEVAQKLESAVPSAERFGLSLRSVIKLAPFAVELSTAGTRIRRGTLLQHLVGDAAADAPASPTGPASSAVTATCPPPKQRTRRDAAVERAMDAALLALAPQQPPCTAFPPTFASTVVLHSSAEDTPATEAALAAALAAWPHGPFGIDCEWVPGTSAGVALLQIAAPSVVLLVRLRFRSGIDAAPTLGALPPAVAAFLADPAVLKVGVNIFHDASRLADAGASVQLRGCIDTTHALLLSGLPAFPLGLASLTQRLCGVWMADKVRRTAESDWEAPELSEAQVRYAADDARASLATFAAMRHLLSPDDLISLLDRPANATRLGELKHVNIAKRIARIVARVAPTIEERRRWVARVLSTQPSLSLRKRALLQLVQQTGPESELPLSSPWELHPASSTPTLCPYESFNMPRNVAAPALHTEQDADADYALYGADLPMPPASASTSATDHDDTLIADGLECADAVRDPPSPAAVPAPSNDNSGGPSPHQMPPDVEELLALEREFAREQREAANGTTYPAAQGAPTFFDSRPVVSASDPWQAAQHVPAPSHANQHAPPPPPSRSSTHASHRYCHAHAEAYDQRPGCPSPGHQSGEDGHPRTALNDGASEMERALMSALHGMMPEHSQPRQQSDSPPHATQFDRLARDVLATPVKSPLVGAVQPTRIAGIAPGASSIYSAAAPLSPNPAATAAAASTHHGGPFHEVHFPPPPPC